MKKPISNHKVINADISITTSLPEMGLLLYLVETLAERKADMGFSNEKAPLGWQSVDSSSVEAYVNGDNLLETSDGITNSGFTSSFLFTCIKSKARDYRFMWLSSLS